MSDPKINEGLREEAIELYLVIKGGKTQAQADPKDPELDKYLLDVVKHHQPPVSTESNCCLKVLLARDPAERKQIL